MDAEWPNGSGEIAGLTIEFSLKVKDGSSVVVMGTRIVVFGETIVGRGNWFYMYGTIAVKIVEILPCYILAVIWAFDVAETTRGVRVDIPI